MKKGEKTYTEIYIIYFKRFVWKFAMFFKNPCIFQFNFFQMVY